MKGIIILVTVIIMLMSGWLVLPVEAEPSYPHTNFDPSVLSYVCRVQGGTYSPPSAECGGCFYCLLPDGTLIDCNGDGNCTVSKEIKLDNWDLLRAITMIELALQQVPQGPPDLVPLPTPASIPPGGFCRRNDQGKLLVNVYNQGGTAAVASKTRLIFGSADPADFDTPAIAAGTGTELVIDIPEGCWDANLNCSFTIGVDANNAVSESNETNNNAAGLCGPQFQ